MQSEIRNPVVANYFTDLISTLECNHKPSNQELLMVGQMAMDWATIKYVKESMSKIIYVDFKHKKVLK